MSSCTACGHQLGVGRFCTNCGHPVDASDPPTAPPVSTPVTAGDWRTDTAERLRPPPPPTHAPRPPRSHRRPPPRYPLFADEVADWPPTARDDHDRAGSAPARPARSRRPGTRAEPSDWHRTAGRGLDREDYDVTSGAAARCSGSLGTVDDAGPARPPAGGSWSETTRSDAARDAGDDQSAEADPTPAARTRHRRSRPRHGARRPRPRRPTRTSTATRSRYDASNMLDGVPETAWRMPGDGTGEALTFTLPRADPSCTRSA